MRATTVTERDDAGAEAGRPRRISTSSSAAGASTTGGCEARLAGSDDWEEFGATCGARPILDGRGNEDEYRTSHAGGFVAMSFRFFDPLLRRWSIYWADSRRCGVLDPPVFGAFDGRRRRLRRRRPVRRAADRRPVRLVRRLDRDPALGAGVLGRRRRDLGDNWVMELTPGGDGADERWRLAACRGPNIGMRGR